MPINPNDLSTGSVGPSVSIRATVDQLMRKSGAQNPSDPNQVAAMLVRLMPERSQRDQLETIGMPFLSRLPAAEPARPADSDFDKSLAAATRLLASVEIAGSDEFAPELRGMTTALHAIFAQVPAVAARAGDPSLRAAGFSLRHQLGKWARFLRWRGAIHPEANAASRRLARALDRVGASLLVAMGRSSSLSGAATLQVSPSEVQARADAAVAACEEFVSRREVRDGDGWPRAIGAYTDLAAAISTGPRPDFRIFLDPGRLSQSMQLICDGVKSGAGEDARELAIMAQPLLMQISAFQRFAQGAMQANSVVNPPAAVLANYVAALRLFAGAFDAVAPARLMGASLPLLEFYAGDRQIDGDAPLAVVAELARLRGLFAAAVDRILACRCEPRFVRAQVIFDKLLYDVDRALDYYLTGTDLNLRGEAEIRAAATGRLLDAAGEFDSGDEGSGADVTPAYDDSQLMRYASELAELLSRPFLGNEPDDRSRRLMHQELCTQLDIERRWQALAVSMSGSAADISGIVQLPCELTRFALGRLRVDRDCDDLDIEMPRDVPSSLHIIADEIEAYIGRRPPNEPPGSQQPPDTPPEPPKQPPRRSPKSSSA
jgi:hypothetical protein